MKTRYINNINIWKGRVKSTKRLRVFMLAHFDVCKLETGVY